MFVVLVIISCVIASPLFFVIASDLPAKAWQAGARQSISPTEIASAGFASLTTTESKCHSGTE
jgi:hypothetical protein